jgi:GNAT superfamily N-acetyltransferase
MPFEIAEISAEQTHDVRRAVLRGGHADAAVVFDGDHLDDTFHLGARDAGGALAGVSTWLRRPYPDRPAEVGYQLRGMATLPASQGSGAGSAMLAAGLTRCGERGATNVWARARDTALGFYARHGFEVIGLGYVDLTTGLPHHDIIRRL